MCIHSPLRLSASSLVAVALGVLACIPLPIPHTEQVTPNVVGDLRSSSGVPIPGVAVAFTGSPRDALCAKAMTHPVVDERGRFQATATKARKTILWLTLMENFGQNRSYYWLCAGTLDSGGAAAYQTRTYINGHAAGDSLACVAWVWKERHRVTCNGTSRQRMFEGGHWAQGAVEGRYRVIVAEDEVWDYPSRAFVQWLAVSDRDAIDSLVATLELPERVDVYELHRLRFAERAGHWYLRVPSTKWTFWKGAHTRWLTFALGPPGDARQVLTP